MIIALFLFAIVCTIILINFNYKNDGVTTISAIIFSFLWYYCIIPIVFMANKGPMLNSYGYVRLFANASDEQYLIALLVMAIFLSVLLITYHTKSIKYRVKHSYVNISCIKVIAGKIALFTYVLGGICFIYYIAAFGGVVRMLAYSEYMRSFANNGEIFLTHLQTIMYVPSRLITVSPILFIVSGAFEETKLIKTLFFWTSFILGFLFYLYDAGKMGIFVYLLSFLVPILFHYTKKAWVITILFGVLGTPLIGIADAVFHYISMNEWEIDKNSSILVYFAQYTFPFSNICNLDGILNLSGIRWCQDFITGFCNLIPGVNLSVSYEPTSMYYGGRYWTDSGGTPNDSITFGFIELWLFGVALMGYLWGCISAKIDVALSQTPQTMPFVVLRCSLILLFFVIFVNADIVSIARNQFTFTILLGLIIYCSRKKYLD